MALPSEPIRIALVSYLNTYPLVWGLRRLAQAGKPEMVLAAPSQCSALLLDGTVHLALVPSITFLASETCFEVLPFGIVSNREVDTVLLAGNAPMEAWDTIYLDEDSLTSVQLARVLVEEKKLHPRFVSGLPPREGLSERSGVLMIGNKCFQLTAGFSHCYDLSRLWFELTGLPFVFALVLAHPQLPQGVLAEAGRLLQAAVTRGAQHLTEVVEDWMAEHPEEKPLKHKEYYRDYLQHKISYALTPEALAGLRTFYEKTALEFPARKREQLTPEYFRRVDLAGTSLSAPSPGADFRQTPR